MYAEVMCCCCIGLSNTVDLFVLHCTVLLCACPDMGWFHSSARVSGWSSVADFYEQCLLYVRRPCVPRVQASSSSSR